MAFFCLFTSSQETYGNMRWWIWWKSKVVYARLKSWKGGTHCPGSFGKLQNRKKHARQIDKRGKSHWRVSSKRFCSFLWHMDSWWVNDLLKDCLIFFVECSQIMFCFGYRNIKHDCDSSRIHENWCFWHYRILCWSSVNSNPRNNTSS